MSFRNDLDATHARAEALSQRLVIEMKRTTDLVTRLERSELERHRLLHELSRVKDNPQARATIGLPDLAPTVVLRPQPAQAMSPAPADRAPMADVLSYALAALIWLAIVGSLYVGFR